MANRPAMGVTPGGLPLSRGCCIMARHRRDAHPPTRLTPRGRPTSKGRSREGSRRKCKAIHKCSTDTPFKFLQGSRHGQPPRPWRPPADMAHTRRVPVARPPRPPAAASVVAMVTRPSTWHAPARRVEHLADNLPGLARSRCTANAVREWDAQASISQASPTATGENHQSPAGTPPVPSTATTTVATMARVPAAEAHQSSAKAACQCSQRATLKWQPRRPPSGHSWRPPGTCGRAVTSSGRERGGHGCPPARLRGGPTPATCQCNVSCCLRPLLPPARHKQTRLLVL